MRVRQLVRKPKTMESDTNWQTRDIQPRYAPVFPRTKPNRAGWRWRSARVSDGNETFILFVECNPGRDNWKALLIRIHNDSGASAVARLDHHGSHPGLHVHVDCERSGIETGVQLLGETQRLPRAGGDSYIRRKNAWTEFGFWEAAKRFFRVSEQTGPLL